MCVLYYNIAVFLRLSYAVYYRISSEASSGDVILSYTSNLKYYIILNTDVFL